MRAWAAALAGAVGLALAAGPERACAQAPGDASASTAAAARNLYEDGIEAAAAERLEDAIAAFERSYELSPRAATLMNLGSVEERAGRLVAALGSYRRFLATADDRLLESHGDAAREAIGRIEARVAHLTIVALGLEAHDEVRLDDAVLEPATLGLDLPVDPGEHTLTIHRPAAEPPEVDVLGADEPAMAETVECARATVTLVEGMRRDAELRARCPAPSFLVTPSPATGAEDPTPFIALGVGGGLAVVGAVVLVVVLTTGAPSPEPPFVGNLGVGAYVVR